MEQISGELLAAGVLALCSLVLVILGAFLPGRYPEATRNGAALLVSALALVARSGWCYAFAMAVLAALIGGTRFAENLAAIFRGSKEYFDYRKTVATTEERERAKAEEESELTRANGAPAPAAPEIAPYLAGTGQVCVRDESLALTVEELALSYLEPELGKPIERNVKLARGDLERVFDGIVQGSAQERDTVFEIRLLRDRSWLPRAGLLRDMVRDQVEAYMQITGKRPRFCFVAVAPDDTVFSDSDLNSFILVLREGHRIALSAVEVRRLTFEELGLTARS